MKFSPEELEEMRRADEEIEQNFQWTNEEIAASREIDASIKAALKPIEKRRIAEYQRAYYEANKDSIAEKQQWIKKRRLDHGYSQRALAEAIGASQPMISRLESGQMKLDTFFAKDALCTVLGVNL